MYHKNIKASNRNEGIPDITLNGVNAIVNQRENLLSLLKRKGYEKIPVEFGLCPTLINKFEKETGLGKSYPEYFQFPWEQVSDLKLMSGEKTQFKKYYDFV